MSSGRPGPRRPRPLAARVTGAWRPAARWAGPAPGQAVRGRAEPRAAGQARRRLARPPRRTGRTPGRVPRPVPGAPAGRAPVAARRYRRPLITPCGRRPICRRTALPRQARCRRAPCRRATCPPRSRSCPAMTTMITRRMTGRGTPLAMAMLRETPPGRLPRRASLARPRDPRCRERCRRSHLTAPRPAAARWSSRRKTTWMCPTSSSDSGVARRSQPAARLTEVTARIEKACAMAGRDLSEVTLIAVTKTYPGEDVRLLSELGVHDFGENRDQEGRVKAAQSVGLDIAWHFIGQLQTRKASSVARYADYVHSVDRARLVSHLGTAARAAGREVTWLVQVSIDGDPERGGAPAGGVAAVAEAIEAEPSLVLGGVMAIAPMGMDP